VAVTGADGAGKTSLTTSVVAALRARGRVVSRRDRWDVMGHAADFPAARFLPDDIGLLRQCVTEMPAASRLLFLVWTMELALTGRRTEDSNTLILTDSYWMKHAASETVYGLDEAWVLSVCSGLPAATAVVYLRVDPVLAWQRRADSVNAYECGMDPLCSRESFASHQAALRGVLDRWADQLDWHVVDADQPLAEVHRQVEKLVDELAPRGPAEGSRS